MYRFLRLSSIGFALAVTCLISSILAVTTPSYAASIGNVSAKCNTETVTSGDEVRIVVSTDEMKISTFIASIEYDAAVMKYQGYEGPDGKQSVYLVNAEDEDVRMDISVEESDEQPVIGMYSIGTSEKNYREMSPLVTLIFKAEQSGKVKYSVLESTDGKDGYTSPEIKKKSEPTPPSTQEKHVIKANSFLIKLAVILAIVLAVCIVTVVIRKRKEKRK